MMMNKKQESDIFNIKTPEFFINMKSYPDKYSIHRKDFVLAERVKCKEGLNINGVYVPGGLYFHQNYYKLSKDIKDHTGKVIKEISVPTLRDNEWIVFNDYYQACKAGKSYTLFGLRQCGKSEMEVSLCLRELSLYDTEALALFSGKPDKDTFVKKIRIAIEHGDNFIIRPNIDKDWSKEEIRFGYTKADNTANIKSTLYIYNTQEGTKIQVGSGKSPSFLLMDEIAKTDFRLVYDAVEPALLSDFGGLRCSPIFTFTGGEIDKAQDAKNLIEYPNDENQMIFEYEKRKIGGRFLSGEYRKDCKKEVLFSDYINKKTNTWIDKMPIQITDFELALNVINKELESAKKSVDKKSYTLKKIFFPLSLKDVFLSEKENPYPKELLEEQQQNLLSNPIGQNVEFSRGINGEVKWKFSDKKPIPKYPVTTEDTDAPIVIYDFNEKYKGQVGLHIIGVDTYNDDESILSDSLGSVYVGRKIHSDKTDVFAGCMVASYTARPKTMREFNETILMLAEFYDAKIMYEHTHSGFKDFFEGKNKLHLLIDTPSLQKEINSNSNAKNTKGLRPTPPNQKHATSLSLDYIKEELDDGTMGACRLLDPLLITELLSWDGLKNTDRRIAFCMLMEALYMSKKYTFMIDQQSEVVEDYQNKTAFNLQYYQKDVSFDIPKKGAFNFKQK